MIFLGFKTRFLLYTKWDGLATPRIYENVRRFFLIPLLFENNNGRILLIMTIPKSGIIFHMLDSYDFRRYICDTQSVL